MKPTVSVFEQAGLADAPERDRKTHLAMILNEELDQLGITQVQASLVLGIPQPRVSMLRNYRLDHFSVDRLLQFLSFLGLQVEINVSRPMNRRSGSVTIRHTAVSSRAGSPERSSNR